MSVIAKWRGERAIWNGLRHRTSFIDGSRLRVGWCLRWVREMFGIPPKFRYAFQNWGAMPAKYRHVTSNPPPRGSVAYYRSPNTNGMPGHIAIGLGGGKILTTDLPTGGRVGVVHYMDPVRRWGHQYVGYGWWINGKVIAARTVDASTLAYTANGHPAHSPSMTYTVARSLHAQRLLALLWVTRRWDFHKTRAYAAWQRRMGHTGAAANGIPGWRTLRQLARRAPNFIVRL